MLDILHTIFIITKLAASAVDQLREHVLFLTKKRDMGSITLIRLDLSFISMFQASFS